MTEWRLARQVIHENARQCVEENGSQEAEHEFCTQVFLQLAKVTLGVEGDAGYVPDAFPRNMENVRALGKAAAKLH